MTVQLRSEIGKPIRLRRLNGRTITIAPSAELPEDEVANNPQIQKLLKRGELCRLAATEKAPPKKKAAASSTSSFGARGVSEETEPKAEAETKGEEKPAEEPPKPSGRGKK